MTVKGRSANVDKGRIEFLCEKFKIIEKNEVEPICVLKIFKYSGQH